MEYLKKEKPNLVISQPCPALVSWIEIYKPDLIPYLSPADSPMAHTFALIKHFYPEYARCKMAAISPCFAKRHEFDENGLGDFNVTMAAISEYLEENTIFNKKNKCENCHHYLLNENIRKHERELKEKLKDSIRHITDTSLTELKESQTDVKLLVENTGKMNYAVATSSAAVNLMVEKLVTINDVLKKIKSLIDDAYGN